MKLRKNVLKILLLVLGLGFLFSPFFIIGNNVYSFINLLAICEYFDEYILILLGILTFIIGSIVEFIEYHNIKNPMCFILFVISGIFSVITFNLLPENVSISVTPIIISVISFAIALLHLKRILQENSLTILEIAEIGVFVSFAIIFDLPFLKIKIGSNGGSISLVMIPLLLLSLKLGFAKGFFASGIIFALITCLTDGYGFASFPFDYFLGFGAMGILGLFKNLIITEKRSFKSYFYLFLGMCLAILARFFAATLSGVIIYKLTFIQSLVYQFPYILPSGGIAIVAVFILYKPLYRFLLNNRH